MYGANERHKETYIYFFSDYGRKKADWQFEQYFENPKSSHKRKMFLIINDLGEIGELVQSFRGTDASMMTIYQFMEYKYA
jgi:hypothetical protein